MEPVVHVGEGMRLLISEVIVSEPPWGGPMVPGWLSNAWVQDTAYFWPGPEGVERVVSAGVPLRAWLARKVFIYFSAKHVVH